MPTPSISFCTVAMNRLCHIQKTLPVNLSENRSKSIQFILLDYNSSDGLGDYIYNNFQPQMAEGTLIYYRYSLAKSFHRSHARNIAFRLAGGEIVCNLDADNFAGPGFGRFTQNLFQTKKNVCLTGLGNPHKQDALGKLCIAKTDFLGVSGYDESFIGYGFEDYDIVNRLRLAGCDPYTITNNSYLQAIEHTDSERISNEDLNQKIENIYVHFIDSDKSRLLYLIKNGECLIATVVNMYTINSRLPFKPDSTPYLPSVHYNIEGHWENGTWILNRDLLTLISKSSTEILRKEIMQTQLSFKSTSHEYFHVSQESMKREAIMFLSQLRNRDLMLENLSENRIRVNSSFGKGIVYKNFQDEPIEI